MKEKIEDMSVALRLILVGVLIFSIIYPIAVFAGGQIWRNSAKGSPINYKNEIMGSELIGQDFDDPRLFHGRPSSINYNAMKSGGRNLAPNNPILENRVRKILKNIVQNRESENLNVPSVLVTESGSALDSHITYRAAIFQIPRISDETGISEDRLKALVEKHTKSQLLGIYGLKRVNVVKLNIALLKMWEGENLG